MGELDDTQFMMDQISAFPGLDMTTERQNTREGTTSLPLLDQHISLLKDYSPWLLPTAGGILAIVLRFSEPLLEYIDLNSGLFQNILESISGNMNFRKRYRTQDAESYITIWLQNLNMIC